MAMRACAGDFNYGKLGRETGLPGRIVEALRCRGSGDLADGSAAIAD
jgi:hypothetical protein